MVSGGSRASSSGRISFGGLASGIDTNSVISQMLAVARRPMDLAARQQNVLRVKADAFGKVTSALSSLQSKAATLNDANLFRNRSATVLAKDVDANKVTVSAATTAAVGSFEFAVSSIATSTRVSSAAAAGQAVDADAALDEAGFVTAMTAGTFTVAGTQFTIDEATATTLAGASVGAGVTAAVVLASAGLDITPAASGQFSINGTTINWANTDTIDDVIGYINASAAGVTASFDSGTGAFTLTHNTVGAGETITVSDVTGNFLQAMKIVDGSNVVVATETAGTDMPSLNEIIDDINNAAIGVTATLVNDAAGRVNALQLTAASTITLGAGSDTSNFLAAASLLESPSGTTRTSQRGLGGTDVSADLSDARLTTALTQSTGTFSINGVSIDWDATTDSLSNIVSRINSAGAGVTASYDPFEDRIRLVADTTGSVAISVSDTAGNLLTSLGLVGATQTLGANAAYSIDGGTTRYSTSNVISDAVAGITLTVRDTTTEPVSIEVKAQTQNVIDAMTRFVTAYNDTTKVLRDLTKYDPKGVNTGILFGDGTVRRIEGMMRQTLTRSLNGLPGGLRTLSDVGLSFGAVGSAVGATDDLVLNSEKLLTVLRRDPDTVAQAFSAFTPTASLDAGGTGSLASITGTPTALTKAGRYTISSDGTGGLQATFQPNDGSAATTRNGSITASGTNATLIPGVTLTAKGALVAGSDQITVGASTEGFAKTLSEYLASLSASGGALTTRSDEMQTTITDIGKQIDRLQSRLDAKESALVKKFAAMEQVFLKIQGQQQSLSQMAAQLNK